VNPNRSNADKTGVSPRLLRRLSDELLGSRLANGEAAAFDELYRRYAHRLAAYAGHLLGDPAAGEDVAQSALMKAYGALRQGQPPRHVRPWLYRIAHNAAIDAAMRVRESPTDTLPLRTQSEGETSAGSLVAALAALPGRQRDAYVLRELHGFRVGEIARELSLTPPQVEQALFAARNRLAEHLTFGDRLDCVAVRRLLSGPLDAGERRALKPHLRSCAACRSEAGLRGRIGSLFAPLTWLRAPVPGLAGSAPVAAKATALVATATFAAAVPVATLDLSHAQLKSHQARPVAVTASAAARALLRTKPYRPAATTFASRPVGRVVETRHADSAPVESDTMRRRGDDGHHDRAADIPGSRTSPLPATTISSFGDGPSGRDPGSDGGSSDGGAQTTSTVVVTTTTSGQGPSDGGSGSSSDGLDTRESGGSDGVTSGGSGGD
jgi:RNA polymerase sigma factor (sigma-70 family)